MMDIVSGLNNVTKFIGKTSSDPMAIVISPVGIHFLGTHSSSENIHNIFRWYLISLNIFLLFNYPIFRCHFSSLISTLQQIHRLGIIHGDIKPGNFFQNKTVPDQV